MPLDKASYSAIGETLQAIFISGYAILPSHPSRKLLESIAATTHITPAQAMAAYRMIHQFAVKEFDDATDPISFRQKLLMAREVAFSEAC